MKSGKLITTLNFGSFPGKIMFTCGFTYTEICKELKKQKCPEWLECFETTKHLFDTGTKGFFAKRQLTIKGQEYTYNFLHLMDVFDFNNDKDHSTLAHEIIHGVSFNLKDLLDIAEENEAFAYTHTHIMEQCYSALRIKSKK